MSKKVLLVVPEAPAVQAASEAAERRLSREGLRIGVLDNSKGNAERLLRFLVEGVKVTLPVKSVVSLRKVSVSVYLRLSASDYF